MVTVHANNSGMISVKLLVILLFLFIVIHVGVKVTPMYISSMEMTDEMVARARFAQTAGNEEILSTLARKAKELGLPLGPEDFKLLRDDATRRMKISTAWNVEIHFLYDIYPPYTVRTFHFSPVVEEDYARKL